MYMIQICFICHMFDSYKRNFILNTMGYFSFQYTERMMGKVTYRTCYEDDVINVLKAILMAYIENQIHLRRQNFDFTIICDYIAEQHCDDHNIINDVNNIMLRFLGYISF